MPLNKEAQQNQAIIIILLIVFLHLNKITLVVNHFGKYHYCSSTSMA